MTLRWITLMTALLAVPAHADDKSVKLQTLLDQVLAEQRVALTCSSLDKQTHDSALQLWLDIVPQIADLMTEAGQPADAVDSFVASSTPDALILAGTTPFSDVRALCASQPDWMEGVMTFRAFSYIESVREIVFE